MLLTPTTLNNSTHGVVPGVWSYGPGKRDGVDINPLTNMEHTFLIEETTQRRTDLVTDGVAYSGGDRAINWDMALAEDPTDFETMKWTPDEEISGDFSVTFMFTLNTVQGGDPLISVDLMSVYYGGIFCAAQYQRSIGGTGAIHAHGGTSGGSVNGENIPVEDGVMYVATLRANKTSQRSELTITNAATGVVIGASHGGFEPGSSSLSFVYMGDYLTNGQGNNVYKAIGFGWTTHAIIPLESDVSLAAPVILNLTQTEPNVLRLKWTGIGLAWKIEKSTNGGAFSVLESELVIPVGDLMEYYDSSVSDGQVCAYRLSGIVGYVVSSPDESSSFTVNNSPSGTESVWQTQALSNASISMSETHTLSQKIKNTSASPVTISEVTLDSEFFTRGSEEYLWLTQNSDGSGTVYGISNAFDIQADGPLVFEFFAGAAIPGNTNFYLFYAPVWARTQIRYQNTDVYFPGQGFNGSYDNTGTLLGSTGALKFELKQREVISDVNVTTFRATTLKVG